MWAAVGDIRFVTFSTYMMESLMKVRLHMALDMAFVCKATSVSAFQTAQSAAPHAKEDDLQANILTILSPERCTSSAYLLCMPTSLTPQM